MFLLNEVLNFTVDLPPDYWEKVFDTSTDYLKDISWSWFWGMFAPLLFWLTVISVIVAVVRVVVEKLIDKLTAKKRLKRDIEESMYWKEVDRIVDEELHYRRTAMRYREIEEKKTEKNKVGRK